MRMSMPRSSESSPQFCQRGAPRELRLTTKSMHLDPSSEKRTRTKYYVLCTHSRLLNPARSREVWSTFTRLKYGRVQANGLAAQAGRARSLRFPRRKARYLSTRPWTFACCAKPQLLFLTPTYRSRTSATTHPRSRQHGRLQDPVSTQACALQKPTY